MKNTWFGKAPWSKMCLQMEQVDVPVGEICLHCDETIKENDEGEMIGSLEGLRPIHRECLIRSLVGSIGHQQHKCSCFGGNEEDPTNVSKREAARIAANYFDGKQLKDWPQDTVAIICCRIGDPYWNNVPGSREIICWQCGHKCMIAPNTYDTLQNTDNSEVLCVNCVKAYYDATGKKIKILPNPSQLL